METLKMQKQDLACNKYAKDTIDKLMPIIKAEALYISKKPLKAYSIAESTLNKYIREHGTEVWFI